MDVCRGHPTEPSIPDIEVVLQPGINRSPSKEDKVRSGLRNCHESIAEEETEVELEERTREWFKFT